MMAITVTPLIERVPLRRRIGRSCLVCSAVSWLRLMVLLQGGIWRLF